MIWSVKAWNLNSTLQILHYEIKNLEALEIQGLQDFF